MLFSGPTCTELTCPSGFKKLAPSAGPAGDTKEARCGSCSPIESKNPCDPNPCQHGGICSGTSEVAGYSCDCASTHWTGRSCETLQCPDGYFEEAGKCVSVATGEQVSVVIGGTRCCYSVGGAAKCCYSVATGEQVSVVTA